MTEIEIVLPKFVPLLFTLAALLFLWAALEKMDIRK